MTLLLFSSRSTVFAGSATWDTNPASGDWNTATNWMPNTVPNGAADTAAFASSSKTNVALSANTEVDGIAFNPGNAYTITVGPALTLTISGVGITNDSGIAQNFVPAAATNSGNGRIHFTGNATAGIGTFFTADGGATGRGASVDFSDSSNAGSASFTINGGAGNGASGRASGGGTFFSDRSSAGSATFTLNGSADFGNPGAVGFSGTGPSGGNALFTLNPGLGTAGYGARVTFFFGSNAADATLIANGSSRKGHRSPAEIDFFPGSSAGHATLVANGGIGEGRGGVIQFKHDTDGAMARVGVFGNGILDVRFVSYQTVDGTSLKIGSLEGDGLVFLGATNLIIGQNDLSTAFSGVIKDKPGTRFRVGGSLTKIGRGKLVLRHTNTYTGGTTIRSGKLMVNNNVGSGTGSGQVRVQGGELGGTGIIAGTVSVGTGSGAGAVLAPGYKTAVRPGVLTIESALTFDSDATYEVQLNSTTGSSDKVSANGVTINGAAQANFTDLGNSPLPNGTALIVIDNTAATPITGAFGNLSDGSTFTSNGNTYQANYEGGDGNDLTLTVVP